MSSCQPQSGRATCRKALHLADVGTSRIAGPADRHRQTSGRRHPAEASLLGWRSTTVSSPGRQHLLEQRALLGPLPALARPSPANSAWLVSLGLKPPGIGYHADDKASRLARTVARVGFAVHPRLADRPRHGSARFRLVDSDSGAARPRPPGDAGCGCVVALRPLNPWRWRAGRLVRQLAPPSGVRAGGCLGVAGPPVRAAPGFPRWRAVRRLASVRSCALPACQRQLLPSGRLRRDLRHNRVYGASRSMR